MRNRLLLAGALVTLSCIGRMAAEGGRLVVHEWGTFLAMNGSDGVVLDGLYHEEHALPPFVHARSADQLRLRSAVVKGETPVIYFYTDRPLRARVRVDFPGGLWTQWYPQAVGVGPGLAHAAPRPRHGNIVWDVELAPADATPPPLPAAGADALWNHARAVDAAYVSAVDATRRGAPKEWERFLFYRGLGEIPLPLETQATDGVLRVRARIPGVTDLYVLRVENGQGAYAYTPTVPHGSASTYALPAMDGAQPLGAFTARLADELAARLEAQGLYPDEARAMVNTWRTSYFSTEGVRLLFLLPQTWTDEYIPLQVTPAPAELIRVMVGRVELLTPGRERRAEAAIRDLSSPDARLRDQAFAYLREQGRYVEPIVQHTLRTSTDEGVRELCRRLLLTDFLTELRTALTDAATGAPLEADPVFVRAQLASLLREVGLREQAALEGQMALAELQRRPAPVMNRHESRATFRALARAHEGAGQDAEALAWYGAFVRFGSQASTCTGCHQLEGPRDMSFFRDWWAGRKFADLATRTGRLEDLIAQHEAALSRDARDVAAQLALAYLYEAGGDATRAGALWARLDPR